MRAKTFDPSRLNNPQELPQSVEWMTREAWEARYPNEFVAVIDPEIREGIDVDITGGYVVCHSPDRTRVQEELMRLRPKHCAVRLTTPDESLLYLL